jgi:hypothetical protein
VKPPGRTIDKYKFLKLFSPVYPKMWVVVYPKGAYDLMMDQNYKPELSGEARTKTTLPIVDWKPEIME